MSRSNSNYFHKGSITISYVQIQTLISKSSIPNTNQRGLYHFPETRRHKDHLSCIEGSPKNLLKPVPEIFYQDSA
jgi:hypothetical protein